MENFNDFRGAAIPLDDYDFPRLGHRLGVGEDEIHAVIDVEAAGGPWDARGRPKMLFEPHRFFKNLGAGAARDRAVREGLAYQRWGTRPYPKDSYPVLKRAMEIDEAAALKSASWGLGQILGENHLSVGYDTVQEMVLATLDNADVHLEMMVAFILDARLDDELRRHDWSGFAKRYNGPQYAKNRYHTKLAAAYARWKKIRDTHWTPEMGEGPGKVIEGTATRIPVPTSAPGRLSEVPVIAAEPAAAIEKPLTKESIELGQRMLRDKGYPEVGMVDGVEGERTKDAITIFQRNNDLPLTGRMDGALLDALAKAPMRTVAASRANATVKDIADAEGVKVGKLTQNGGRVIAAAGTVLATVEAVRGALGENATIADVVGAATQASATYQTIMSMGPWMILAAIGAAGVWLGRRQIADQVAKFRTANHV